MNNKRIKDKLFGIVIGVLLTSTIGYAAYKYQATEVGYTPSNANFKVDNVSDAIKELYKKCGNGESESGEEETPKDILGNIESSSNYQPNGYYKSTADDNNVIFGGYCWKIIRKNDDEDIRMLYNGTPNGDGECTRTGTDTQIDISKFSTTYNVTDYASSTVKGVVDNWYNNNLATNYLDKITAIDLITREEVSNVNGGYLVSGQQYWTQTPTGNTTTSSSSCNYNQCGGSGSCNGTSNTIYIVGSDGAIETNNNGTYSSCTASTTCTGSCENWEPKTNNTCMGCSGAHGISWSDNGCSCCNYYKLTGSCTATPEGSSLAVRPVITLKNTVTLQGGQGTTSNPYYLN